jgi:hypothetical protein
VIRDIVAEESLFESPRADIGLQELESLVEGGRAFDKYRLRNQLYLTIEIAPLVATIVRQAPRYGSEQLALFPERRSEMERLKRELDRAVEFLGKAYYEWACAAGREPTKPAEEKKPRRRKAGGSSQGQDRF